MRRQGDFTVGVENVDRVDDAVLYILYKILDGSVEDGGLFIGMEWNLIRRR